MEVVAVVGIAFVGLTALRIVVLPRTDADRHPRLATALLLGPSITVMAFLLAGGLVRFQHEPLAAVAIVVVAGVPLGLLVCAVLAGSGSPVAFATGDVPRWWLDYIVWTAVAVPVLFGALLVVLAITGSLGGR